MAYTERYVTDAAGGGGDGSSGSPWTLAEALASATAADRVNIQSDGGYAIGADTVDGTGTIAQMLCFRGYNSSIGDLENQGWNSDGTLNVTNFPVITSSGTFTLGTSRDSFLLFQNIVWTGAIANAIVNAGGTDVVTLVECKITNTMNNNGARAVIGDNFWTLINCDLECSGATHSSVVSIDNDAVVIGCRFKGVESGEILLDLSVRATVINSLFQGASLACIGVDMNTQTFALILYGNTFYDLERAVSYANSAATRNHVLVNNHATDNTEWINNLYSGTANKAVIEVNNRTRDNTTPRTGIGDGANVGEVTTDTGGASTDYTNAGSNDFTLISAAPGKATGMRQYTDIGAYQRQEAGGGGGGGKQAGGGGGQVG